jgi:hypothetical protein
MPLMHWLVSTWTGWAVLGTAYAAAALCVWSLCVAAGRADDVAEDMRWV